MQEAIIKLRSLSKKSVFIFLLTIFVLGTVLRFYNLTATPAGFQMDEASKGYSAYSLLKTGRDDNNNLLPLNIDIFGDNSPAGYHYTAIIPVAVFGLNEFAVRFPGALFGSLTILAFFFLVYTLFNNKKLSLLSSFLLAISPWHINMSRASSESLVALFFIILGFSFVFWSIKTQRIIHVTLAMLILSLSFLFYQTPKLFVPILFLTLLIFFFRNWKFKINSAYRKSLIFSFLFLSLLVFSLFFIVPGGSGRFTQVNIFNAIETKLVIDEQIKNEGVIGTSPLISRIFHNKIIGFTQTYTSNYLKHFSFDYLFVKGLPPLYQIPGIGVFYLVSLPFTLLGLFLLLVNKNYLYKIPVLWITIGPLAASISNESNNLQRSLVMYPMFEILTAFGILYLITKAKNRKAWLPIISILFILNFIYFHHQYFTLSKAFQPWYRNNGFAEMMKIVNKNYKDVDKIITTKSGGGYPLFQFYTKYDPIKYQKEGSPKDKNYKGFGKFFFTPDDCPFISKDPLIPREGKLIFVEHGSCKETKALNNINYLYVLRVDGTKAFRIVYLNN